MSALATDVNGALERTWRPCLDRLRDLVRARSVTGNELAAQRLVADALARSGASVELFDVSPRELAGLPGWGPGDVDYAGRPNVVGTIRGAGSGRSLILNAHIDSVPPGPAALWDRDPWSGTIEGDRLYGRGAWDDKVGIAVILWVVEALRLAGARLAGDLIVESVIEEETSGNGTLACAARGYRGDAAIVVDGRGPGNAVTAHCGQLWIRFTARGLTAAAVESHRGRNAIELLLPLITALREVEAAASGPYPAPFDRVEHPLQFNPGVIRAGETPTTVPGLATLDAHLVFPPTLSLEDAKDLVRETVARVAARNKWIAETVPVVEFLTLQVPPFVAPPSDRLLSALDAAQRRELGAPLEVRAIAGFGDLRHFQLHEPTPCCLYGAGTGGNAHAANEWLDLATVPAAARVLASFVLDWCGTT